MGLWLFDLLMPQFKKNSRFGQTSSLKADFGASPSHRNAQDVQQVNYRHQELGPMTVEKA